MYLAANLPRFHLPTIVLASSWNGPLISSLPYKREFAQLLARTGTSFKLLGD